jgi:hypothetical protein
VSLRLASHPPSRAALPQQLDLLLEAPGSLEWPVRSSARARRLSARVFRDGRVEIVVPLRARPPDVARFVSQHRAWIEQTRQRALRAAPQGATALRRLPVPVLELPAVDERWTVRHEPVVGRAQLEVEPFTLQLRAAAHDQDSMRSLLVDWLRERLRAAVQEQLAVLARMMDTDFTSLRVGCQRSRWGSCSRQGTISLNCCLLFQTPQVLRYLMVHELAHRQHMNHGPRFWRLVERHEPAWRQLDRELSRGWRQVPGWIFARTEGEQ